MEKLPLGGSWVLISRVKSRVAMVISFFQVLTTLLLGAHAASKVS